MRSPDTYLALGIVVLIFLSVSLATVPTVVAADYPLGYDTRIIRTTLWQNMWSIIATYMSDGSTRSFSPGYPFSIVETTIDVSKEYASTSDGALENTRAYVIVVSPTGAILFEGIMENVSWEPNDVLVDTWELSYYAEFPTHTLVEGTYTITVSYDVLVGGDWTHADAHEYSLLCGIWVNPDTRLVRTSLWRDKWNIIATYMSHGSQRSHDSGYPFSIVEVTVDVNKTYATTSDQALSYTRAYATVVSPTGAIVFDGLVDEVSWVPNDVLVDRWELSYYAEFTPHLLEEGTYTISVDYDVLIGGIWTNADSGEYYLVCTIPSAPETRIVRMTLWQDKWSIICTYLLSASERSFTTGYFLRVIETTVQIKKDKAATAEDAIANTRVSAIITSPYDIVVFSGGLNDISWEPNDVLVDRWDLAYYSEFSAHILQEGTYSIAVTYEVWSGISWEIDESRVYYLTCGLPDEPGPVPPGDPAVWLPIMMSFAVIVGMAFIGFNLSRGSDPTAVLFMLFCGVTLTWMIGWLDLWIFLTAVALIALATAASWSRLFGKGK